MLAYVRRSGFKRESISKGGKSTHNEMKARALITYLAVLHKGERRLDLAEGPVNMRPLCCRAVPALAALGLLLGACLSAAPLHAFTFDARRIGMGSVQVPGGRELAGRNVAYQSVPSRPEARGFVVPLPLGLIQMAADMPTAGLCSSNRLPRTA